MEGFLIRAAVVGIRLWLASKIVSGIAFSSTETLIAALCLLASSTPSCSVVAILTCHHLLTLGLFLLVINALMILLVAYFLTASSSPAFGRRWGAAIVVEPDELGDVRLDRPARARGAATCAEPARALGDRLGRSVEIPSPRLRGEGRVKGVGRLATRLAPPVVLSSPASGEKEFGGDAPRVSSPPSRSSRRPPRCR